MTASTHDQLGNSHVLVWRWNSETWKQQGWQVCAVQKRLQKKEETSCLCWALNIQPIAFYSFPSAACTWPASRCWTSREQRGCWNCSELLSEVIAGIWKLHLHTLKPCTPLIIFLESKFRVGWKRPMIEVHQGQFAGFALAQSGHQSRWKVMTMMQNSHWTDIWWRLFLMDQAAMNRF